MRTIWHLAEDTPRDPERVLGGVPATLTIGTWPTGPSQRVAVSYAIEQPGGTERTGLVDASWHHNSEVNSYWVAQLPAARIGDRIRYQPHGVGPDGETIGSEVVVDVGPPVFLALMWHHHQPLYRDLAAPTPRGSYQLPWVRLHGIRDYYSMAALVARYPQVRVSFNLTPVLLAQLEDYALRGATDRHLDLTLTPAESLAPEERSELVSSFFDADWHNQVLRHERYAELFRAAKRKRGLTVQELRDLQMWSNLTWFGTEFQRAPTELATGEIVRVDDLVRQGRGYTVEDIQRMVEEQAKILRAVVPLHGTLQERGQIEVVTSPYFHPILPLLIDTDEATVDRDGGSLPSRFHEPEDAETQVRMAVRCYERCFGRPPSGMWPAEGAISQATIPLFAGAGIRWIASDAGVLARSGQWGYRIEQPEIGWQAYRIEERGWTLATFFRDSKLSDWIGFEGQSIDDPAEAAERFLAEVKRRVGDRLPPGRSFVLPLVLDGENAWGAYSQAGAPFLAALYDRLSTDPLIATTTFADWLAGRDGSVAAHPVETLSRVHDLRTGSWIDEPGSRPGVDLGTWIGEPEENRAWELLAQVRQDVRDAGLSPADGPELVRGLLAAEGSDWFWWFGEDQSSSDDGQFDRLFRSHLKNVYLRLGLDAPEVLELPLVSRVVSWALPAPAPPIYAGDRLCVRTNCPGRLIWRVGDGPPMDAELKPVRSVVGGAHRYCTVIGPLNSPGATLNLVFQCEHPRCEHHGKCPAAARRTLTIEHRTGGSLPTESPPRPAGSSMGVGREP